jgi:two-component system response regulator ChvI
LADQASFAVEVTTNHDDRGELDKVTARIVIVDDDELFRESLVRNLSDAGFATLAFREGASALHHVNEAGSPDIILLDWKLPSMTGIEFLAELRSRSIATPVVFLTVIGDQIYEEAALHRGAVDFIEKSRGFSIILRRIDLILSGYKLGATFAQQAPIFTHGHLGLRRDVKRALWKDIQIDLTATEFKIVDYLASRAGHDVRYRELYDLAHGEGFAAGSGDTGDRVNIRSFIKRIRQKFRKIDSEFAQIENYLGFGYRWSDATLTTGSSEDGEPA